MVGFAILGIILFVVAIFRKQRPKQERISPLYAWAEKEGYDAKFARDYIDHLNNLNYKKSNVFECLDEMISATEYSKSAYKHCYIKSKVNEKFKEHIEADRVIFETELGTYELKKEFRGVNIEDILTDADIQNGIKQKVKEEYKDLVYD